VVVGIGGVVVFTAVVVAEGTVEVAAVEAGAWVVTAALVVVTTAEVVEAVVLEQPIREIRDTHTKSKLKDTRIFVFDIIFFIIYLQYFV